MKKSCGEYNKMEERAGMVRISIGNESMLVEPLALYFFANGIGTSGMIEIGDLDEAGEEELLAVEATVMAA